MVTGIIGSGFGLYGYLPAVLQSEEHVILSERAKEKFYGREELRQFSNRIIWVADADELLKRVETLIISTPPDVQKNFVTQAAIKENIKNFILEKPLASNAKDADQIINLLEKHCKNFRINYSFFYTRWFKNLERSFSDKSRNRNLELDIVWNFKAHHYANNLSNWKRLSNQGGGVINFFGIHLIAVISRLNFNNVISSEAKGFNGNDIFYFNAVTHDNRANICNVRVNSNSKTNLFKIVIRNRNSSNDIDTLFESESPFEESLENKESKDFDVRVPLTYQITNEVKEGKMNDSLISLYKNINVLWSKLNNQADTSYVNSI